MKKDQSRKQAARRSHEGCDVQPVVSAQAGEGDALDVRLEPKAEDLVEALEEDPEHSLDIEAWSTRLRQVAPDAFGDRPKPRRPAAVQPGSDAKILVMQQRMERGEDLFAPGDLQTDSDDILGREIRRCRNGRDERGSLRKLKDEPTKGGDAA